MTLDRLLLSALQNENINNVLKMNITLLIVTKENEYRVLNVGLSPSKKNCFKNDENCIFFPFKSSFRFQDI